MTARMTVFRTRRHVEAVGVSGLPDRCTTLRVDLHPFDEFIERARMERVLLNCDQLHVATPHRLAMAPNLTRSAASESRACATNWNLGIASYAMISNFMNLVTFETCRSNELRREDPVRTAVPRGRVAN